MGTELIFGGKRYDIRDYNEGVPILCFNWEDDGLLEFKPGDGYNKERDTDLDTWVWHWTGGEASPDDMAPRLMKRKLGIETAIGARFHKTRYAAIYQFCDPQRVDTADAGYLNNRSGGTEMVNYAYKRGWNPLTWVIPRAAKDREIIEVDFRGRTLKHADFYPEQIGAAIALSNLQHDVLGIPKLVPGVDGDVLRDTWDKKKLIAWLDANGGGNVGHYMANTKKADPAPGLMLRLGTQDGWQLREAA